MCLILEEKKIFRSEVCLPGPLLRVNNHSPREFAEHAIGMGYQWAVYNSSLFYLGDKKPRNPGWFEEGGWFEDIYPNFQICEEI
jgi:hypothetical protein